MDPTSRLTDRAESRALTGLRGVGALLVIVHHFYLHTDLVPHPAADGLLRRGYMGVDLFFVLSGFVLSLAYGAWFDGVTPGRLARILSFLVRRIARLWPLHAALLLIILAIGGWGPHQDFTARPVIANLAMIQAWGLSQSLNPPTWSISTEFLAYLLFPALAAPVLRGRLGPILGAVAVTLLLAVAVRAAPPLGLGRRGWLDIYQNYSLLPLARCLAGFILGMLAWRAGQTPAIGRLFTSPWTGPAALLAFLAFLLAGVNDLMIYLLLPLIVLGMHFGTGPIVRIFAQGPLHHLGVLSYAVYVIHFTLLYHFPLGWAPLWLTLVAFFITMIVLATLAHRLIELPGRHLIRRLAREPNAARALAAHPALDYLRLRSIFRR